MIFGMTPFTFFHVLLSLVGIASGLVVLLGWLRFETMPRWTLLFLGSTLATVLTGFPLAPGMTPAVVVGLISLVLLGLAFLGLYRFRLAGLWRPVYIGVATASLYLNVFVFVVQAFQKIPPLHAFAPTGSEPPFAVVQGLVLVGFVAAGYFAIHRARPTAV